MPFTDRFIEITIATFDGSAAKYKNEEDCERLENRCKINPFKIESYQESIPIELEFSKENQVVTNIIMESGESHLAKIPIDQFEKLLNAWQNKNQ